MIRLFTVYSQVLGSLEKHPSLRKEKLDPETQSVAEYVARKIKIGEVRIYGFPSCVVCDSRGRIYDLA